MPFEPWLRRAARRHPDRVAVQWDAGGLTYAELEARAEGAAEALAGRGADRGSRVALLLPAGPDLVVWFHGCLLAGAVAVPVDPRLSPDERAPRLRGVAAVVQVVAPSGATTMASTPRDGLAPEDVLLVVHTSGTTAEPRPVALTAANVEANAVGSALALGLDPAERWLCPLPLAHVGGLMVLLRSVLYATTAVLAPPPFDAGKVRVALADCTLASLVPTQLARLLDAGLTARAAPRLRAILLGGGPADPALLERARAADLPVAQTYGLTEACSQVTVSTPGEPETAGWPIHGVEVALAPDGEILVAGPTVAGGGTLRTGDLGTLDARGRLTLVGRKADTIVTGGENVAPAEVEAVLLAHPAVAEAGVFPRPSAEWGEAVTARVRPRDGAAADRGELRAWCAARLAGHKVPKTIELTADPLPRTPSGKLLRRALAAGPAGPPDSAP